MYGLLNVLEFDIDTIRTHIDNSNLDKLIESVNDTDSTLQKLLLAVGEIEYILKLDTNEGP